MSRFLMDAFDLVGMGFAIFPLQPNKKIPFFGTNGCKDASTDLDVITDWHRKWPTANIGVATGIESGANVIDIDVKGSAGGLETLERFRLRGHRLPREHVVATPSGGFHVYVRYCEGIKTNSASRVGPGIDVRSNGGYVVAPCSVIDGKPYEWLKRGGSHFVDAPLWLVDALKPKHVDFKARECYKDDGGAGVAAYLSQASEGTRNNVLFWAACLAHEGQADIQEVARAAAAAGMGQREIKTTIWSAARHAGKAKP